MNNFKIIAVVLATALLLGCDGTQRFTNSANNVWRSFLQICDVRTIVVSMAQEESSSKLNATCSRFTIKEKSE